MAYTQNDLVNLQAAIAKGAAEVQIGNERVRYQSLDQMLELERKIKVALGQAKPRPRMINPTTNTGFR